MLTWDEIRLYCPHDQKTCAKIIKRHYRETPGVMEGPDEVRLEVANVIRRWNMGMLDDRYNLLASMLGLKNGYADGSLEQIALNELFLQRHREKSK